VHSAAATAAAAGAGEEERRRGEEGGREGATATSFLKARGGRGRGWVLSSSLTAAVAVAAVAAVEGMREEVGVVTRSSLSLRVCCR